MNKKELLKRLEVITSDLDEFPNNSLLRNTIKDLGSIQTKLEYIIDELDTHGIEADDENVIEEDK